MSRALRPGRKIRGLSNPSPGGTYVGEMDLRNPAEITQVAHGRALVLVRWARRPVASVVVAVERGRVTATAVRSALEQDPDAMTRLGYVLLQDWLDERVGPIPTPPAPTWSVIVCTRDRPADLRRCLESLLASDAAGGDIVVVDNGSTDDATRRLVQSLPGVRYIREDRPGLNWARARGAREAGGGILLYTDDDVVVSEDWVANMLRPFAEPRVAAVTALVLPLELETHAQHLFEVYGGLGRGYLEQRWDSTIIHPAAAGMVGAGASMAIRRSLVVDMRLFDIDLDAGTRSLTGGDTYAFYRLLEAGYLLVYTPEAVVRHRHRKDEKALRDALYGYSVGGFTVLTRALVDHRDAMAIVVALQWLIDDHVRGLARAAVRKKDRMPVRLLVPYLLGCATGIVRYGTLRRSERAEERAQADRLEPRSAGARQPAVRAAAVGSANAGGWTTSGAGEADGIRVSVIVPSHNRERALDRTLEGLASQTLSTSNFEVIVSLDGSIDGSEQVLERWRRSGRLPNLRWRNRPRAGQAAARNAGAAMASTALLVFLDDDVVPDPDCLATHVLRHEEGARVVVGDAPIERRGERSMHLDSVWSWWEDYYHARALPGRAPSYRDLCAGNFSIRRDDFVAAGGFDERFTGYGGEDYELGYRLYLSRLAIEVEPEARARHWHRTSAAGMVRATRQEARGDVLLGTLHPELRSGLRVMRSPRGPGRPLLFLAMRAGWLGDAVMSAGMLLLPVLERLADRRRWARIMKAQRNYAYWRGVADALGSKQALEAYQAGAPPLKVAYWEPAHGPSSLPALEPHTNTRLVIRHDGETVGEIIVAGPAEAPVRRHLRAVILESSENRRLLAPLVAQHHGDTPLVAGALHALAAID
jgi:GT2 family glycosyltransferase